MHSTYHCVAYTNSRRFVGEKVLTEYNKNDLPEEPKAAIYPMIEALHRLQIHERDWSWYSNACRIEIMDELIGLLTECKRRLKQESE